MERDDGVVYRLDGGTAGPRLPHVLPEADVDPAVIAAAARALQVEASRWARLRVGEELCYEWLVR